MAVAVVPQVAGQDQILYAPQGGQRGRVVAAKDVRLLGARRCCLGSRGLAIDGLVVVSATAAKGEAGGEGEGEDDGGMAHWVSLRWCVGRLRPT